MTAVSRSMGSSRVPYPSTLRQALCHVPRPRCDRTCVVSGRSTVGNARRPGLGSVTQVRQEPLDAGRRRRRELARPSRGRMDERQPCGVEGQALERGRERLAPPAAVDVVAGGGGAGRGGGEPDLVRGAPPHAPPPGGKAAEAAGPPVTR